MITEEDVSQVISGLKNGKSQGPSGMGPIHLKHLVAESGAFLHELTKTYNHITQNPD